MAKKVRTPDEALKSKSIRKQVDAIYLGIVAVLLAILIGGVGLFYVTCYKAKQAPTLPIALDSHSGCAKSLHPSTLLISAYSILGGNQVGNAPCRSSAGVRIMQWQTGEAAKAKDRWE